MTIVKVKTKGQITLPADVRQIIGLQEGDFLELRIQKGKMVFTPKHFVDRQIAEGLKDIKTGRVHGPYKSVKSLTSSLKKSKDPT